MDGTDIKNLFSKHVDSQAEKDEIRATDRVGSGVEIFVGLVVLIYLLIHLGRPTGFFTEEFGTVAAFLLFASMVVSFIHQAGRVIVGRQNVLRPLEAGSYVFCLISGVYLLALFPFDFSHFAEPLPRFLEFTLSWISDGIAKFGMAVGLIILATMSIYTSVLHIHVKRAIERKKTGI